MGVKRVCQWAILNPQRQVAAVYFQGSLKTHQSSRRILVDWRLSFGVALTMMEDNEKMKIQMNFNISDKFVEFLMFIICDQLQENTYNYIINQSNGKSVK